MVFVVDDLYDKLYVEIAPPQRIQDGRRDPGPDDIDAWLASQAAAEAKARGGKPAPTFANVAAGAPANDEPGNDDVPAVTP